MAKQFSSATAFKSALEARLRKRSQEDGIPFSTLQLKFVIERLLARLFRLDPPPWLLKGGFAMDLRFRPRARTTKDIDLSVKIISTTENMLATLREQLQEAVEIDLGDYLTFRIGEPKHELTNAPQGGARYPCEAFIVGKVYAKFHIDIGIGDALIGVSEKLIGDTLFEFAGMAPIVVYAIPKHQQFAEKVHAYTFPWSGRTNTRTKDLVDLVLLIERGLPDAKKIRAAIKATFETRGTHPIPETLSPPPASWEKDFTRMAEEADISTHDCRAAFAIFERFWTEHGLNARGG